MTSPPTFGAASSTVLTTARSARGGVTAAVSWSSSDGSPLFGVESGSATSLAVISAAFVEVVALSTRAVRVSVADALLSTVPTVHSPVPSSNTPCVAVQPRRVMPLGNVSTTRTPVASAGPSLVTVTLKVTLLPTLASGLLTVLTSERSASSR